MIRAEWLYWVVGLFFLGVGVLTWLDTTHPRRLGSGAFWTLLALTFPYGTFVVNGSAPPAVLGAAVIVIAVLAGFGLPGRPTLGLPPEAVALAGTGSSFALNGGPVALSVPGHYNVLNAATSYAVARWFDLPEEASRSVLSGYVGTYAWSLTDDTLTFTLVEDACGARRILFTAEGWARVP